MEQNGYIYIADGNEEIYKKITENKKSGSYIMLSDEMLFDRKEALPDKEIFADIIKEYYRPLLEKQDILLINSEKRVVEAISYLKTEKEDHIRMLLEAAEGLTSNPAVGRILNYIIAYMTSKNLTLLKNIYSECVKGKFQLNTLILKKMAEFFSMTVPEREKAKMILVMLRDNISKNEENRENQSDRNKIGRAHV